jgi:D-alanine-D-alanine ligase
LTPETNWQAVIEALGTVFVKPALEGSSLGMSKAGNAEELEAAYRHASTFGADVMAEQFVSGPEYTVAVLGDRALPSIRIDVSGEFYNFEAKYHSEETRFTCPSDLAIEEEAALSELALAAFAAVGGEVWGRVDVMRESGGAWQLLEVNTVPGMTSHSLVPLAATVAGLSLLDLLTEIYEHSLEVRHDNQ